MDKDRPFAEYEAWQRDMSYEKWMHAYDFLTHYLEMCQADVAIQDKDILIHDGDSIIANAYVCIHGDVGEDYQEVSKAMLLKVMPDSFRVYKNYEDALRGNDENSLLYKKPREVINRCMADVQELAVEKGLIGREETLCDVPFEDAIASISTDRCNQAL